MKFACAPETRPLPGYTVKRAIDRGAFGEVYYGVSDGGKEVALKLLHENPQSELRGVSQCLNLKHPNLVTLFDIKSDEQGDWWVVMEYIRGPNLEQRLSETPKGLPLSEVGEWLRGLAAGVDYLHEQKIVHRDLKPGNVFREGATVKIGDVGLAKFMAPSRRSAQTESVGTVYYMAPEVAHGRYGREVDLYSLGVMLYEMLTGQLPFDGESTGEILMKHLTQPPDLARVPAPLRPVLAHVLEKDPAKRTPTAGTLLKEFEEAIREPQSHETHAPRGAAGPDGLHGRRHGEPCRPGLPPMPCPPNPCAGWKPFARWSRGPSAEVPPAAFAAVAAPPSGARDDANAPLVPPWVQWSVLGGLGLLVLIQPAPVSMRLRELLLLGGVAIGWVVLSWWAMPDADRPTVWKRAHRSLQRCATWSFLHLYARCVLVLWVLSYLFFRILGGAAPFGPLGLMAFGLATFWGLVATAVIKLAWEPRQSPARPDEPRTVPATAGVHVAPASPWAGMAAPPPLPTAARQTAASKSASATRASSAGTVVVTATVGELLLSMARAGVLVPLISGGLFFGLPEWDRSWSHMQREETLVFFTASALLATWGILIGAWYLNRPGTGLNRPRFALVVLGVLVGFLIGQWHTWLGVELPYGKPSDAMFSRIGSHPLVGSGQPTILGFAVFFGLLFGARSWWEHLAPRRAERWDGWQVVWVTVLSGLVIPIAFSFPNVWAGLWGATLGLALPLAATWRPAAGKKS